MTQSSRGLRSLSALDQFIVGCLILLLLVFGLELMLLVPCGGWHNLPTCTASVKTNGAWTDYFAIDPFWSSMPDWYVVVMNFQDFLFNPFWGLSLVMYLMHRQDTPWFRTATIIVSSMIITTSAVVFLTQAAHPGITGNQLGLLLVINAGWALLPALFIFRMHSAGRAGGSRVDTH
ncbi:hypothetical protein [Mycolicibacterium rhodesiae]|nr:hypothetical protein [Mycolicibacterium rhodesiae]MCV7346910.1 hypothetical protein [Mycolicibacterium rhodesiae]